jgi:hypothetical protein
VVDARARTDEAVLRLGDHELAAATAHGPGLPQDDRELVLGALEPPLGLRDDLVRDHDDVAACQPAGALERVPEQPCEVVARAHLGNAEERDDRDRAGDVSSHARPRARPTSRATA